MKQQITESLVNEAISLAKDGQIDEAVNKLLANISVGDTVGVLEGVPYPAEGRTGKVKAINPTNPGFIDVEMPNGAVYTIQSTLLIKV